MSPATVSRRAARIAQETTEVVAFALGNLVYKIHCGRLSRTFGNKWLEEELRHITGAEHFVLGGTIGTQGFTGELLPLLVQERIQSLYRQAQSGRYARIQILRHGVHSSAAGCLGAFHLALGEAQRAQISRLALHAYGANKFPLMLLIDVGGTKTEVRLAQIDSNGEPILSAGGVYRMDTQSGTTPFDFYRNLAVFVAQTLARVQTNIYEILPFVAMGQPGRFQGSKAPIGEKTARDLGADFPGCLPSHVFGRALTTITQIPFDVHVCNDGRAQFCGIVETLRRQKPSDWEGLLGKTLVYLGIGTGLGFGYGTIGTDGNFILHDLLSQFDVVATEPWEALPRSTFFDSTLLAPLPFEYSSIVCGKFISAYLHAAELNSVDPLLTPLTSLKYGSPSAIKNALCHLSARTSPLNAALVNEILEPHILESKTDVLLRLQETDLFEILKKTLSNFSRALGHTMVANIDDAQYTAVVEEIERAKRRGKEVRFIGIGKSHTIGENLAQIFTNLGIPATSFDLTGANCENLTVIAEDDVLFLISNSGESRELLRLFPNLKSKHCTTVAITGNVESSLAKLCQYRLNAHVEQEAHSNKEAPTTSTTAALAVGAAVAIVASHHLDHNADEFYNNRPGLDAPLGSRFAGASKNAAFDPVAKICSAYRAFAESIKHIHGDEKFARDLLALARRILVSHKSGRTVFFTGAGGGYFVAKKIAATLTSIGIKAHAVNCAQLPHGDLGQIEADNLLVMLSFRGETDTLLEIADRAKTKMVKLALITGRHESRLAKKIDLQVLTESIIDDQRFVRLPDQTIFASFLNLAVGDALAVVLSYMEPISDQQFATNSHPGGVFARRESRIDKEILDSLSRDRISQLVKDEPGRFAGVVVKVEEEHLRSFIERRCFSESGAPEVMIIGMGGIGLAYLAPLIVSLGKEVYFVEKMRKRIEAMELARYKYDVLRVGLRSDPLGPQKATISRISASWLSSESEDQIASRTLRIDHVFTAVGLGNLQDLALLFAKMVRFRYAFHIDTPLNLLLCENMPVGRDTTTQLRSAIALELSAESIELRHYFETHVGLVSAINEAIVPQVEASFANPIPIEADLAPLYIDASEWKLDSSNQLPSWPGVQFKNPFEPIHLRKLLVHNMTHALVGFLGHFAGHTEMSEAVLDAEICALVRDAANTVARALYADWRYSDTQHGEADRYVSWILDRYNNPELGDQTSRVCRDPLRKLEQGERLIGAINYLVTQSLNSNTAEVADSLSGILIGVAAAMRYAVDTGCASEGYAELREKVISRLALDSRYLDEAERAFNDFLTRRGLAATHHS